MKKIIALLLLFTVAFVSSMSIASHVSTRYVFLDDQLNTVNGQNVDEDVISAETIVRNSNRIIVITPDNATTDIRDSNRTDITHADNKDSNRTDIDDNSSPEKSTIVIMEETTFNKFMDLR